MGGTVLQQVFIVEFTVAHQMCDDCHRKEAQDYWHAMVCKELISRPALTFKICECLSIMITCWVIDFLGASSTESRKQENISLSGTAYLEA